MNKICVLSVTCARDVGKVRGGGGEKKNSGQTHRHKTSGTNELSERRTNVFGLVFLAFKFLLEIMDFILQKTCKQC